MYVGDRESTKLNLRRETVSWRKWGLLASGLGFAFILAALQFFPVGSDAGGLTVENPVGSDMVLRRANSTLPDNSSSKETQNRQAEFPSLTRYQMSSVTPRRNRRFILSKSKKTLKYVKHEVKKGENIWKIARSYGLKTYSIISANYEKLTKHKYLPVGVTLRIPNRNGILAKLKRNQTLWDLMQTYGTRLDDVLSFNEIESASSLQRGQKIFLPGASPVNPYRYQLFQGSGRMFSWPVSPGRRYVSSEYGKRKHPVLDRVIPHLGIDIAAKYGTAIFAARAGIVEYSGKNGGYGYMVKIRHGERYSTVYSHLSKLFVSDGQYVQRGQRIGEMGQSGLATGSNLHFEIRKNDKALDPIKFLTGS